MGSKLQQEIRQERPFGSLKEELFLNLSRTAGAKEHEMEQGLRPYGLSPTQYNVLRILRGSEPHGLSQSEIGTRLVAQVPDVPRILERMQRAGWVRRERAQSDRRVVMVRLSAGGRTLVDSLDGPILTMLEGMFGMPTEEMQQLCDLLVQARRLPG